MKLLFALLVGLFLAGLGAAEYMHQASGEHNVICVEPGNRAEEARALLLSHLYGHR
jgi:hypothetical protein